MQSKTKLEGHTSSVWSVCFSPNGQYIVSCSNDGIKIWRYETLKVLAKLEHEGGVVSVEVSSDSSLLVSGSGGFINTIKIWDMKSFQELGTLKGHTGALWSVKFSPDFKIVASGSYDQTVRLWDVQSMKEITKVNLF